MKTILVVGGTGAQGTAVIRILLETGDYSVLLFTRDVNTPQVAELVNTGRVEAVANTADQGYDLDAFEEAARKAYGVFVNTDGFSLGEQAETYWGMQLFERSCRAGVSQFVYSGLDDVYRASGYDPKYYVGHYIGKSRVQDYLRGQPTTQKTAWTIIRSGPYIEMLSEGLLPKVDDQGDFTLPWPLADGAAPFLHLDDFGRYVAWVFSHRDAAAGLDLGVAMAHATGRDVAAAITAVTGRSATYQPVPIAAWVQAAFAGLPRGIDTKVGYRSGRADAELNQTYGQNFTAFWNMYHTCVAAGDAGLVQRDYALLDEILPGRVRGVEEWMRKTGYTGERVKVLKNNVTDRP